MKFIRILSIILILSLVQEIYFVLAQETTLSFKENEWIGEKVFENECSNKSECLLHWNEGEDFLSLGIGHFIWYPQGQEGPFEETFPKLLAHIKSTGTPVPQWLDTRSPPDCPWRSREGFIRAAKSPRTQELREFMLATKSQQASFLIKRFEEALPVILDSVSEDQRDHISKQFYRLAGSSAGVYALVDYINFKGLGVVAAERYQGKGWGLAQVLAEMSKDTSGPGALEEFARAAEKILIQRVANSPPERNEKRWLAGWLNRVRAYCDSPF